MSRPPQFDASLDLLERPSSLTDYTAGDAAIVRTIESRQHALVCGWGTPPFVLTLNEPAPFYAGTETRQVLLRVPPYCRRMRVAVYSWGALSFGLSVTGLAATLPLGGVDNIDPQSAWWDEGSAQAATPGVSTQSLEVLAGPLSTWSTVTATVAFANGYGQLLALAFYPVLEPAV